MTHRKRPGQVCLCLHSSGHGVKLNRTSQAITEKDSRLHTTWEGYFEQLTQFVKSTGHASVPLSSNARLYKWCLAQRTAWRNGQLPTSAYRALSSIGFQWDPHFEKWKQKFYELVEFKQTYGHCLVPQTGSKPVHIRLARWVAKQRHLSKNGLLPDDRRRRLEGIGFSFSPADERFSARVEQLRQWAEAHGHANVPRSWAEDPGLARWADAVRLRWRQGRLPTRHYRKLSQLGFNFAPLDSSWEANFQSLEQFVRDTGHCTPSFIEEPRLSSWLAAQRRRYANGSLFWNRKQRLYNLGVDLRPPSAVFAANIALLKRCYYDEGTLKLPPHEKRLRQWLAQIRALGPRRLSTSNLKRLRDIGLVFANEQRNIDSSSPGPTSGKV